MRHVETAVSVLAVLWTMGLHGFPGFAAEITLAREGEPAVAIVVPAEKNDAYQRAAGDLQKYIRAISGAEVPVVADDEEVGGPALFVGPVRQAREADLPPEEEGIEAFAVRVRDGNVFFAGRETYAVEFAVYSFLEDRLGIRWFWPGPWGEHIPPQKRPTLTVEATDEVRAPDWSPRIWSGNHFYPEWQEWNRHSKLSLTGALPWRQFQNNIYRVFPPEKYAEEHPEYYPLINGERWIPSAASGRYWRPCESNPEVRRLILEYARESFDRNPWQHGFSVGMDDISHLCQCDNCRALDPSPEAYKQRQYSDRHYWLVNELARELRQTHPDKYIGTLIYNIARTPPTKIDTLEPNVFGFITQCEAEWWREGLKEEDFAITQEWRRRCEHLCRYTYWGLGWITPRYFPHSMAEALKFDRELDFHGIYVEVYTCWPNTAPMIWAGSKLFWDTSLDIDELLGEFCTKMYGEAAPQMARYYAALEAAWQAGHPERRSWGHNNLPVQSAAMDIERLGECERLLAEAKAAAKTEAVRERIGIVEAGLRFGGYAIRARESSDRLMAMPVTDAGTARAALQAALEFDAATAERETEWAEIMARDDLAGQNFTALSKLRSTTIPKIGQVEGGGAAALLKALAWYDEHDRDGMAAIIREHGGRSAGVVQRVLRAYQFVAEHQPANLLANPGFESVGENTQPAERDWSTEGAPPGWSTWHQAHRDTEFTVHSTEAHGGRLAARIREASSACFLQSVPVKPGERYLCRLWARREPVEATGAVRLMIRWQDAGGAWLEDRTSEASCSLPPGQEGWQPLAVCVEASAEAGRLVLMCSAAYQNEEAAWFDDAAVVRVEW